MTLKVSRQCEKRVTTKIQKILRTNSNVSDNCKGEMVGREGSPILTSVKVIESAYIV